MANSTPNIPIATMPRLPSEINIDDDTARKFLDAYNTWSSINSLTPAKKLEFVKLCYLPGAVTPWRNTNKSTSWPTYEQAFKKQFFKEPSYHVLASHLRSLQQAKNEPSKHFGAKITESVQKLQDSIEIPSPAQLAAMGDDTAKAHALFNLYSAKLKKVLFVIGAKSSIQSTVTSLQNAEPFDDLVTACQTYEDNLISRSEYVHAPRSILAIQDTSLNGPPQQQQQQPKPFNVQNGGPRRKGNRQGQQQNPQQQQTCIHCQGIGHRTKHSGRCPMFQGTPQQQQQQLQNNRKPKRSNNRQQQPKAVHAVQQQQQYLYEEQQQQQLQFYEPQQQQQQDFYNESPM